MELRSLRNKYLEKTLLTENFYPIYRLGYVGYFGLILLTILLIPGRGLITEQNPIPFSAVGKITLSLSCGAKTF